jgi:hypothetical protein
MTALQVLKIVACVLTAITGAVSLFAPQSVTGFTGLRPEGGRGISEIRAVLGGLFLALGVAPLVLNEPTAYRMVGIGYLTVGAVRVVSMLIDKSVIQSNLISLAVEIVFGVVLVL